jgi:hypothetical protein
MKQYTRKQIIDIVAETFEEATEEVMNGETAVNLEFYTDGDAIGVSFDIDLGRGGIDSYHESYVEFKDGTVTCRLGESLEGCGIEEEVEERLTDFAEKLASGEIKVINEVRTIEVSHDSDAMDMLSAVQGILDDFGVKYTSSEDDVEPTIVITYEKPIN